MAGRVHLRVKTLFFQAACKHLQALGKPASRETLGPVTAWFLCSASKECGVFISKVLLSSSSSSGNQEQWQEPDQKDSMFTMCVCARMCKRVCVCQCVWVGRRTFVEPPFFHGFQGFLYSMSHLSDLRRHHVNKCGTPSSLPRSSAQGFQFFHCFCLLVNFWYLLEMVLEMKPTASCVVNTLSLSCHNGCEL